MPSPGGTIYAIGAVGTSWVKIGCTTGPVIKRLQTLQTGQPFPLQVLAAIPVETDAHRIERQVHAFLEAERRRGEWFDVPMDMATREALIVRAVAYLAAQEAPQDRGEMEQTIGRTLGERVMLSRRRRALSQRDLAAQAQMSPTALNRLERGLQSVSAERLATLARLLDVSADYLLGLREPERSDPRTATMPAPPPQPKRQRPRHTKAYASERA